MGVGKSTVGLILAGLLDFEFVDTDRVIETREGRRISDIFAAEGEPHFRDLETNLVREYETRPGLILSTGGGLVVRPENLASLRKHSLIVCLWASPAVIFERVRHQGHRPLLQTPAPLARITELLEQRKPAYQQADILVGWISAVRRRPRNTSPTASGCCTRYGNPRRAQRRTPAADRSSEPAQAGGLCSDEGVGLISGPPEWTDRRGRTAIIPCRPAPDIRHPAAVCPGNGLASIRSTA